MKNVKNIGIEQLSKDGGKTWVKKDPLRNPGAYGKRLTVEDFRKHQFHTDTGGALNCQGYVDREKKKLEDYADRTGIKIRWKTMKAFQMALAKASKEGTGMTRAGLEKIAAYSDISLKSVKTCLKAASFFGSIKVIYHRVAYLNPKDNPENPTMLYVGYRQRNCTIIFTAYINFVEWAVYNATRCIRKAQEMARRVKDKAVDAVGATVASINARLKNLPSDALPRIFSFLDIIGVEPSLSVSSHVNPRDISPLRTLHPSPGVFYDARTGEILGVYS